MISMLMTKERRPAFRTTEGWARSVLIEAGAIRECEEHGWAKDCADPHARDRALLVARQDPLPGVSQDEAVAAVREVLGSIGDTCPECSSRDLYLGSSTNATSVPLDTRSATRSASQFVRRTQPCDSDFDTFPGNGVPWMP